jgi:hypothetical protein
LSRSTGGIAVGPTRLSSCLADLPVSMRRGSVFEPGDFGFHSDGSSSGGHNGGRAGSCDARGFPRRGAGLGSRGDFRGLVAAPSKPMPEMREKDHGGPNPAAGLAFLGKPVGGARAAIHSLIRIAVGGHPEPWSSASSAQEWRRARRDDYPCRPRLNFRRRSGTSPFRRLTEPGAHPAQSDSRQMASRPAVHMKNGVGEHSQPATPGLAISDS